MSRASQSVIRLRRRRATQKCVGTAAASDSEGETYMKFISPEMPQKSVKLAVTTEFCRKVCPVRIEKENSPVNTRKVQRYVKARCNVQGCNKKAREGSDNCISHGGGLRCQADACSKSAAVSSMFCIAHGG